MNGLLNFPAQDWDEITTWNATNQTSLLHDYRRLLVSGITSHPSSGGVLGAGFPIHSVDTAV